MEGEVLTIGPPWKPQPYLLYTQANPLSLLEINSSLSFPFSSFDFYCTPYLLHLSATWFTCNPQDLFLRPFYLESTLSLSPCPGSQAPAPGEDFAAPGRCSLFPPCMSLAHAKASARNALVRSSEVWGLWALCPSTQRCACVNRFLPFLKSWLYLLNSVISSSHVWMWELD